LAQLAAPKGSSALREASFAHDGGSKLPHSKAFSKQWRMNHEEKTI
jgi:hypothetical protein